METTQQDIDELHDYEEDTRTGARIAEVLKLRRNPQDHGYWLTSLGSKTSAGIARTVRAIQREATI